MIALSTGSLHTYTVSKVFAMASEAGYDGIEIIIDGRKETHDPDHLYRLSFEYKLPIVTFHSPFLANIENWPHDQLGRLKRTIKLAKELSVPLIVTHLPLKFQYINLLKLFNYSRLSLPVPYLFRGRYYHFIRSVRLEEIKSKYNIIIALENMPARRIFGFTFNAYWFNTVNELSMFPYLTLDTTHLATWGHDSVEFYLKLKKHVAHIHISNYDGKEHRAPQNGKMPLGKFLHCLADDNYSGVLSVETAPDALNADDERKCRKALKEALLFCRTNMII